MKILRITLPLLQTFVQELHNRFIPHIILILSFTNQYKNFQTSSDLQDRPTAHPSRSYLKRPMLQDKKVQNGHRLQKAKQTDNAVKKLYFGNSWWDKTIFFSVIDLKSEFHQTALKEADRKITAKIK